ncbi:MAG: hypothetical protein ACFFB5_06455 [Promethearchaeota archaeon]
MVTSRDGAVGFCLQFKLWNEPCPARCDQFVAAPTGSLEVARDKKFDIDCVYFTRITSPSPVFYCTLYRQSDPFCDACLFPKYMTDPSQPG